MESHRILIHCYSCGTDFEALLERPLTPDGNVAFSTGDYFCVVCGSEVREDDER